MSKGIKVDKSSWRNVVPAFVMWLDQTYPHISGVMVIEVEDGAAKFKYRPNDAASKLSDQDKFLIRKKWEQCMKKAEEPIDDEMCQIIEYLDSAIESISQRDITTAIHLLVDALAMLGDRKCCGCEETVESEEF